MDGGVKEKKSLKSDYWSITNFAQLQYCRNNVSLTNLSTLNTSVCMVRNYCQSYWDLAGVSGNLPERQEKSTEIQGKLKNMKIMFKKVIMEKTAIFFQSVKTFSLKSVFSCSYIYNSACLKLLFKWFPVLIYFKTSPPPKYLVYK